MLMDLPVLDKTIYESLNNYAIALEKKLQSDVILYLGDIDDLSKSQINDQLELLASHGEHKNLAFNITTNGGVAESVESMVDVMRCHYDEVYFIVYDHAFSAGTILCMSGDKIYMDNGSSLGPIDPQVYNKDGKLVPAQGYLDQFENLCEKSRNNTITQIEVAMALKIDLADLNFYQQAKELTTTLLKEWLVKYKFKNWKVHSKTNFIVTEEEKEQRAASIAAKLGDNSFWHSHGRHIGIRALEEILDLKIENFSKDKDLAQAIRQYNNLAVSFAITQRYSRFIHSKFLVE